LTISVKYIKNQLIINLYYEKVFNIQWWVGKIALFGKALVSALARGALAMCAMWVGFLSSFLRGEEKTK